MCNRLMSSENFFLNSSYFVLHFVLSFFRGGCIIENLNSTFDVMQRRKAIQNPLCKLWASRLKKKYQHGVQTKKASFRAITLTPSPYRPQVTWVFDVSKASCFLSIVFREKKKSRHVHHLSSLSIEMELFSLKFLYLYLSFDTDKGTFFLLYCQSKTPPIDHFYT